MAGMPGILVFIQCPKVWTQDSTLSLASYVFALGKSPSIKLVTLFCDSSPSLVDKLPRSMSVKIAPRPSKPNKLMDSIFSLCASSDLGVQVLPIDLVLIVPDVNEIILPEAIQCSALAMRTCHYAFLREKLDPSCLTRVEFLEARHWMLGQTQPSSKTYMTKYATLMQDQEDLREEEDYMFETLTVLKKRVIASPLPSLSCPLPLDSGSGLASLPPAVPWKQVNDLIKSVML